MPDKRAEREHVDVVVVGSGFGGSVAAYRLAEAGRSVVLLERGRDYPPGSFARSPAEMNRAFWDPRDGLYGMFDVWRFRGMDSVVSSGLGGGSLIYANVLLRKDERWFVHEQQLPGGGYENWPVSRADLDPHYDDVERMLGAAPYPFDRSGYADTPKTRAMQDAAVELGLGWQLPPLAVSFAPEPKAEPGLGLPIVEPAYGNLHGRPRRTCVLCGECDIGCNDGAKNSLDHTYLSAARHHGADLRTLHEVRAIRPRQGGGYEVDYVQHQLEHDAEHRTDHSAGHDAASGTPPVRVIGCDRLVLAAGTYGTSYLLLRSREHLPGLSEALGTRYSGNGDLLTFLMRATDRNRVRPLDASHGPVITSAIRLPDELDGVPGAGRGGYIEDGGYPGFIDWLVEGSDAPSEIARAVRFLFERCIDFFRDAPDTNLSEELSELIGAGALSVSSLPLLGMGRDVPDGVLRLRDGRLDAEWSTETSTAHFERLRLTMQRIAHVLGADYLDNPTWFRKRIITAHPLGGAPMGRHPGEGVCDAYGEVFGHPGLYVADGAALPGPVGVNPSLTIAALADRMCTRMLQQGPAAPAGSPVGGSGNIGGRETGGSETGGAGPVKTGPVTGEGGDTACDSEGASGPVPRGPRAGAASERTSLSFTEEMKGFYRAGLRNPLDGTLAEHQKERHEESEEGAARQEGMAFRLTITADDVDRFLDDSEHTARAEGWIDAAVCGGRRPVLRGWFNLFAPAGAADRRLMNYRLQFIDGADRPRTLTGWKDVHHGPLGRIWPDTSTLFFRLLEGHVAEGGDDEAAVLGAGILRIELADFVEQLTTFRTRGPHGVRALARFGRFFAGELWDVYAPGGQD